MIYEVELLQFVQTSLNVPTHFLVAPDNSAYPAATLQLVSAAPDYTQDGIDSTNFATWQIDIWADKFSKVSELKSKLFEEINTFGGGQKLLSIEIEDFRSGIDTTTAKKLFRYSVDVSAFYA